MGGAEIISDLFMEILYRHPWVMILSAFAHALSASWDIFLLRVTITKLTLPVSEASVQT